MIQEFEIDKLSGTKFRVKEISPVDLLALTMSMDLKDFNSNRMLLNFALENMEVKVGEKWFPVKVQGRNVFMPQSIDKDLIAVSQLTNWFMENILNPVFMNASE
jgi:hypothetical protein